MQQAPRPRLRVVSISMADGTPLTSLAAQQRIARALLAPYLTDIRQQPVQQPKAG